jgi:hypothetical protein
LLYFVSRQENNLVSWKINIEKIERKGWTNKDEDIYAS